MDLKIKVNQEVPSELASQNESDSVTKELAVRKNNDTIEWYNICEVEIKEKAPVTGCFSQTERQVLTKDLGKKMIEAYTHSSDTEGDTETPDSLASDVYLENESQFLPKDLTKKKKYSSDCEIEIIEQPQRLERTAGAQSYCDEIKDGRNTVELPRSNTELVLQESASNCDPLVGNDLCLNARQHSSEIKESRKQHSGIRETTSIAESPYSELPGQFKDGKIHSVASIQQNHSYECDINKKNITCLSTLVRHNLTDKCGNAYKSDLSQKGFTQLSSLTQHSSANEAVNLHLSQAFTRMSNNHKDIRPYKCEVCDKTFIYISKLKRHYLNHTGIKPYKCEFCEKTCAELSDLKKHTLIHRPVKPHKCKICEKTFTVSSSLKQHILIHMGIKPHKCEICEKSFTHLPHLKQHLLIHEGVKPHTCEICGQSFSRLSSLKRHVLLHEGVKPHKCEVCDKTFTRTTNLKLHIESSHGYHHLFQNY